MTRCLRGVNATGRSSVLRVRSVIDLEAPHGSPYEYLNHAIFFGTLTQPTLKQGESPYYDLWIGLAHLTYRAGQKIEYDGASGRVTNVPEANALLRRTYRSGWTLNG